MRKPGLMPTKVAQKLRITDTGFDLRIRSWMRVYPRKEEARKSFPEGSRATGCATGRRRGAKRPEGIFPDW